MSRIAWPAILFVLGAVMLLTLAAIGFAHLP